MRVLASGVAPLKPEMQTDFQDRLSATMALTDAGGGVGFEEMSIPRSVLFALLSLGFLAGCGGDETEDINRLARRKLESFTTRANIARRKLS